MLVRFELADYLCFGEPAELLLRQRDPGPGGVELPDRGSVYDRVLLVGPGGGGKSALLRGLGYLRGLVLGGVPKGPPPRSPNKRGNDLSDWGPTRLVLTVFQDAALWRYSIEVGSALIERERLDCTGTDGRERLVFERTRQGGVLPAPAIRIGEGGAHERAHLELVAFGTRPEQPFLAEALLRGSRTVQPLGTWLRERLQLLRPEAKTVGLAARCAREPAFARFVAELLHNAGFGVRAITATRRSLPHDYFETEEEQREVLAALTGYADGFVQTQEGEIIAERDGNFVELYLIGLRFLLDTGSEEGEGDGHEAALALSELSDGALRLLHLAPVLYGKPPPGHPPLPQVFFIDELDRSLHPELCRALVRRFAATSELSDGQGRPQLIATTHDAALIDPVLFPARFVVSPGPRGSVIAPLPKGEGDGKNEAAAPELLAWLASPIAG